MTTDIIEQVLLSGDLKALTPDQRIAYCQRVCETLGLNPLTRPFEYITLNGKLTLYARKDATDQLRRIHDVSISAPKIEYAYADDYIIVTVEGRLPSGRTDSEIGVVSRKDMGGNLGNAIMKAVTKAKRRLTLSICGLGWLDETEVETIPDAEPLPDAAESAPAATSNTLPAPAQPEAKRPCLDPYLLLAGLRKNGGWVKPAGKTWAEAHHPPDNQQRPPTEAQIGRVASVIEHALSDGRKSTDDLTLERHLVLRYAFGRESAKELTYAEAGAILKAWEQPTQPYGENQYAGPEARALLQAALEAAGQAPLPIADQPADPTPDTTKRIEVESLAEAEAALFGSETDPVL